MIKSISLKRFSGIFITIYLFAQISVEAQSLPFTHYTERELNFFPSTEVLYVYQDSIGYIWFSFYSSGLGRYNSTTMETYSMADGLIDLSSWEMAEDSKGRLWVTSNAGLVASEKPLTDYGTGEAITFVTKIDDVDLLNHSVYRNKIALDRSDRLWVGTENMGVVRYGYDESGAFIADTVSTRINEDDLQSPVRAVEATDDGGVWVALTGGNILYFDENDHISSYNTGNNKEISVLYVDEDGLLWGGEQEGLIWQKTSNRSPTQFVLKDQSSSSNILDITSDSNGNILASSVGEGILKISTDEKLSKEYINRKNGLLGNIVYNVIEDREKNIWIAQSGGVSKLRYNYRAFKNITATSYTGEQPLLPASSVGSVIYSSNSSLPCRIFAGTTQGGLACINEQFESQSVNQEDGLPNNWINGLELDEKGRLWVGTTSGLVSLSKADANISQLNDVVSTESFSLFGETITMSNYRTAGILAAEKLRMPVQSSSEESIESIWFPGNREVYVVAGDQFFIIDDSYGLPATIYHTAAFDGDGYLWLGTSDHGIYRSKEPFTLQLLSGKTDASNEWNLFEPLWTTENGAPSNLIDKMLWANDLMWIGTAFGLTALEGSSLEERYVITTESGLLANNATSFAISPVSETLWVGTNGGLAEVNPEMGTVLRTVTRQDGLVDNEVWFHGSVDINDEGQVFYGTANGVSIYDPAKAYRNEEPPVVRIERVQKLEEHDRNNQYTFEYSALSFGNENGIQYQTRLIGFSDEWSQLKSDKRINYTNLPAIFLPKEYIFEVRAINESNISSVEPAQYSFLVPPPLLLEWWAFLGYLSIIVFVVVSYQQKQLIKKEREKAREKELEHAKEIEKAYKNLELAHEDLKSAKDQLVQQEKLASLGQLTAGIAHEIKNPLNFVNNFSEVSVEMVEEAREELLSEKAKGKSEKVKEALAILDDIEANLRKIHEHGSRADSIVKSMLQHSRGGDGLMEPTPLNPLIKEYVNLAYHGMRAGKDPINVEIELDLSEDVGKINLIAEDFSRVILNLCNNAFDACAERSRSAMREKLSAVSSQPSAYQPKLTVRTLQKDKTVSIEIEDNGTGIPEEIKDKILQPFFTTKKGTAGTGLGLSITHDIVKAHGGELQLRSSPGKTVLVITIAN